MAARKIIAMGAVSWLFAIRAIAQETNDAQSKPSTPRAPRVASIVVSSTKLLSTEVVGGNAGVGLGVNWEFFTSERSSLAIHASYRTYSGEMGTAANQLSYGLLMKHFLQDTSGLHAEGLYLNYGLLMQVVRLSGVPESGTAHDTKLAAGYDFGGARHWFLEAAYHYSRIKYYSTDPINVDYAEVAIGCRISNPPE